jgi:hypothetical protein
MSMIKITKPIKGLNVFVQIPDENHLVIDCSAPGDNVDDPFGPRFWLERAVDSAGNDGWKLIVHTTREEPEHCFFIIDGEAHCFIYNHDDDEAWPEAEE